VRVCVVGSGGREHALTLALARTAEVVAAPGNPGIAEVAECTTDPVEAIDADLYVIGPEAPLVDGLADRLREDGRLVFGPGADGARLEGSKAWMKEVLVAAGVPTARHRSFGELKAAEAYLSSQPGPYVVKTDGLAAGKGVLVTDSLEEALADLRAKLSGSSFGKAGTTVVVEEHMEGPELSLLALCDGTHCVPLAPARDHKRALDGDRGANTGGMGAYSPVPDANEQVVQRVMDTCIEPLVAELRRRGIDYRGVLYAGLMLTDAGPKVVEFNVRFGDPEAQVVLTRYTGDLAGILAEAASGRLCSEPTFAPDACVTVVLASPGYPESPRTGDPIAGVEEASRLPGVTVYHAGTARDGTGRLVTAGGRVLDVTAIASTISQARERAYEAAAAISWPGIHYRRDIAAGADR
jgi:phosphoribosylamine--glycine ligase